MDAASPFVIGLDGTSSPREHLLGGKAATLVRLRREGFRIADGFCLTTACYRHFVAHNGLAAVIRMELGRKPLGTMRWEELWDAALRIRSAFSKAPIPSDLAAAIETAYRCLGSANNLAVRSSAPGEDSTQASFAGLHETVLDVDDIDALMRAVRRVWASLWSDAALLYRRELSLDPRTSSMAVLVQELVSRDVSGVAFGRNPAEPGLDQAVVEAVPGRCSDLVDGRVEPDRWTLSRTDGAVLNWRAGQRGIPGRPMPLLRDSDLVAVWDSLRRIESLFGYAVDLEWTGRRGEFTLLQARPISTLADDANDGRRWYLSLRPAAQRLRELAQRVSGMLIPELEALGRRFAAENLRAVEDSSLAEVLTARLQAVEHWRRVYRDEFIPFAHGVRQLAVYYNDWVQPEDAYEFVGLLRGQNLLALQRNRRMAALGAQLASSSALSDLMGAITNLSPANQGYRRAMERAGALPGGPRFIAELKGLLDQAMDVSFGEQRLAVQPQHLLRHLFETARAATQSRPAAVSTGPPPSELEQRLFAAVGPERRQEAEEIIAIGRLSWRIRDDDNILLARLEAQLLEALGLAAKRLSASGRLPDRDAQVKEQDTAIIVEALLNPAGGAVELTPPVAAKADRADPTPGQKPRQLLGQPAAPGMASGLVRIIDSADDLNRFRAGEVLVCRAIEPTMTHLAPLARAIVELRGGMLIHGAIIARELGIPCVNGIPEVMGLLKSGDLVTVDGYLGILTVGAPEFDLEGITLGRYDAGSPSGKPG